MQQEIRKLRFHVGRQLGVWAPGRGVAVAWEGSLSKLVYLAADLSARYCKEWWLAVVWKNATGAKRVLSPSQLVRFFNLAWEHVSGNPRRNDVGPISNVIKWIDFAGWKIIGPMQFEDSEGLPI